MEVVEAIGSQMLILGGKAADEDKARACIRHLVQNRKGLKKFRQFVRAQHGSASWIGKKPLTRAPQMYTAVSTETGYITAIHGRALGELAMRMGAGRARDLAYLEQYGYQTVKVQPVDMFPRTHHVESVALMSRKM